MGGVERKLVVRRNKKAQAWTNIHATRSVRNGLDFAACAGSFGGMDEVAIAGRSSKQKLLAYILPMLVFIIMLGVGSALKRPDVAWWRAAPEFWIYPLQTLLCAVILVCFRRQYEFHRLRQPIFTTLVALLVFVLWIAPQQFFGFVP